MVTQKRLLDRDNPPDDDQVNTTIGREVLPLWENVHDYLRTNFPGFEPEWFFYNPQHGWAIRYRKDMQQLCLLFPERGSFTALITLSPEEEASALEKISYFNARIREALNQPSSLPQGRWLWIRLEDHTDFFGFRLLIENKRMNPQP